jgi:membrane-associated protein
VDLAASLVDLLPVYGPKLLFVLAILETSFVTGFVVPSGLATSAATVLALDGRLDLMPVVVAAIAGGFVGDTVGFWIGRAWGHRILEGDGRWARLLAPERGRMSHLFGRHPLATVTVSRLIAFARTVMPMASGMSGLSYRRYVRYEVMGLLAWAGIYVGIGFVARESWEVATRLIGVAGTVVFAAVTATLWIALRRRGRARETAARPEAQHARPEPGETP